VLLCKQTVVSEVYLLGFVLIVGHT